MKESIQYQSDHIDEVYKKLEDTDSIVEEIKRDEITEDFVIKTKKKLTDLEDRSKNATYLQRKKLWKEKVFVNEDFSEDRASIRKGLLQKAKDLRSQNKAAKVVYDRLIAYEKERGNDISEAQGDP